MRSISALAVTTAEFTMSIGAASAAEDLKLTLNWAYAPPHEAILYALEMGMYEAADIDLGVEPGRGSSSTVQIVAAGSTDIGLADGGAVAKMVALDAPVTIVGVLRQSGGYSMIVRDDSPIHAPKDLEGRSIALPSGTAQRPLFDALVPANDIDLSKVDVMNVDSSAVLNLFIDGQVDAFIDLPGYVFPQIVERGVTPRAVPMDRFGVDMFGHSFVVRDEFLAENRDLIRRFLEVTYTALAYTMTHLEEATDIMIRRAPEAGEHEAVLYGIKDYSENSYCPEASDGLGRPSDEMLAINFNVMHNFLEVSESVTPERLFDFSLLPNPLLPCPNM